jgi:hypothetical protein
MITLYIYDFNGFYEIEIFGVGGGVGGLGGVTTLPTQSLHSATTAAAKHVRTIHKITGSESKT